MAQSAGNKIWYAMSLAIAAFLIAGCFERVRAQEIVQTIQLPNTSYFNQAWALTVEGGYLYVGSATDDLTEGRKIMKLDFDGNLVDSIIMPQGFARCQGIAFSGTGQLFFVRRYEDACTFMRLTTTGTFLDSVRTNQMIGGCMAFPPPVGNILRYTVYGPDTTAALCIRSFPSGILWSTIRTPTSKPYGVTTDGAYLYYVENGSTGHRQGIYKTNDNGELLGYIPEPEDSTANGTNPIGLACNGRYLWLLAEPVGADSGRTLYKYDLFSNGIPSIVMIPAQMDFGNVALGQTKTLMLEIHNQGNAPLHILEINFFIGQFGIDSTRPFAIQPQTFVQIPITFRPTQLGFDYGDFYFRNDDPYNLEVAWLATGYGVPPTGVDHETTVRHRFNLHQNYPNPFNPSTEIRYQTSEVSHVSLKVFDLLGREVAGLVDKVKQPGEYSVHWNASHVSSGVFFYRLQAGTFIQTKKMILMR